RVRSVAREFFISTKKRPTLVEAMSVGGATPAHREIRDAGTSRSRAVVYKLHRRPGRRKAGAARSRSASKQVRSATTIIIPSKSEIVSGLCLYMLEANVVDG